MGKALGDIAEDAPFTALRIILACLCQVMAWIDIFFVLLDGTLVRLRNEGQWCSPEGMGLRECRGGSRPLGAGQKTAKARNLTIEDV